MHQAVLDDSPASFDLRKKLPFVAEDAVSDTVGCGIEHRRSCVIAALQQIGVVDDDCLVIHSILAQVAAARRCDPRFLAGDALGGRLAA